MNQASATAVPAPVSMGEAFKYWLKLGFVSFGGPAGQISMMHQELVEKRRWISEHRFLHALSYCNVLPGPEAQQLATYIGWLMHGTRGGIIAGSLFVLPSLFILIALSWLYMAFGNLKPVIAVLDGIKPAVIAIVVFAAYRIGSRALKNNVMWGLAVLAFIGIAVLNIPFPYIILGAGIIGYFGGRFVPQYFKSGGHHGGKEKSYGPALIDDDTPLPQHAHFVWSRVIRYAVTGLVIWFACMALLYSLYDWKGDFTQMGWFFTKTAMLTIGGAYAVLPYVSDASVTQYAWLDHGQMVTGLALGETTPGPLIMVVAYVGFIGGWTKQVLGPDALVLAGIIGASIATFFTFLPSFIFILVGAPAVERTRHDIKFAAPLVAITAAVVGVILNLAVFLGKDILFHGSYSLSAMNWYGVVIMALAFIAMWKFKIDMIKVIIGSAVLGLAYYLARPLTGI